MDYTEADIKKTYYHLDPKFWKWVSELRFGPHHNFPANERLRNKARSIIGFNDMTGEDGPPLAWKLSAFVRKTAWAEKAFYALAAEYKRINEGAYEGLSRCLLEEPMILTDLQNAIIKVLASSKKIRWTAQELSTNLRSHEVTKTQRLSTSAIFEAVEELGQYGYVTYQSLSGTKHLSFTGLCLTDEGRKLAH